MLYARNALILLVLVTIAALGATPARAQDRAFHCAAQWAGLAGSRDAKVLAAFIGRCRGTDAAKNASARLAYITEPRPAPRSVTEPQRPKLAVRRDDAELAFANMTAFFKAKEYAEVQTAAKAFTAKYPPSHPRWSNAQDLLGQAYEADEKPNLAAVAFYDNYRKAPRGNSASASLVALGDIFIRLKKPSDACKVYSEALDVFGGRLNASLRGRLTRGQSEARCDWLLP